ncbi:hypothetical protein FEM44_04450 [Escherichia sp. E4742]|nr:hypothetical protein FEM44_04450 [Escherichia sp. E4742]TLJ05767.1 hypothetical protein FEK62_04450 [Escherichia sp. E4742]
MAIPCFLSLCEVPGPCVVKVGLSANNPIASARENGELVQRFMLWSRISGPLVVFFLKSNITRYFIDGLTTRLANGV